ncbi:MAG: DUF4292 domain-containing protein [Bacteroidaceae bacterium]|nr:DUF4292 domain-containing protein [Bacteroidaceae bacterium]
MYFYNFISEFNIKAVKQIANVASLLVLALLMSLTSCRSSKKAIGTDEKNLTQNAEVIESGDSWKFEENYTAKVSVKVMVDDKDLSTNGQLKMRKDDVILLTLVDPVLGVMEVGRMEISTDSILVIDRINKHYILESYETLSAVVGRSITFDMIQNLFWTQVHDAGDKGTITLNIPLSKPITLSLKQSNIGHDSEWKAHSSISNKYERVSAVALFKSLIPAQ